MRCTEGKLSSPVHVHCCRPDSCISINTQYLICFISQLVCFKEFISQLPLFLYLRWLEKKKTLPTCTWIGEEEGGGAASIHPTHRGDARRPLRSARPPLRVSTPFLWQITSDAIKPGRRLSGGGLGANHHHHHHPHHLLHRRRRSAVQDVQRMLREPDVCAR